MHQQALWMSHSYFGAQQHSQTHTLLTTVSAGPILCKIHLASVSKLNFQEMTQFSALPLLCRTKLSETTGLEINIPQG